MVKSQSKVVGSTLGRPKLIEGCKCQSTENWEAMPSFETERALSVARLQKKNEFDARFAEIIEMIRETRQLIEQTIAQEFEPQNDNGKQTPEQ
jgi:hypothetical protein